LTSLARPTLVQGAAAAAASMAVLLAAEAWTQLQQPEGVRVSVIGLIGHNLFMIALPLLAVCIAVACSWLMRRARTSSAPDAVAVTAPQVSGTPPDRRDPHTAAAAPGASRPSAD
jgi:hypothetical protein